MFRNLAVTALLMFLLSAVDVKPTYAQQDAGAEADAPVVDPNGSAASEEEQPSRKEAQRRVAIVGMIAVGGIVLAGTGLLSVTLILGRRARRPQLSQMTGQSPSAAASEPDEPPADADAAATEDGPDDADASARDTEVT